MCWLFTYAPASHHKVSTYRYFYWDYSTFVTENGTDNSKASNNVPYYVSAQGKANNYSSDSFCDWIICTGFMIHFSKKKTKKTPHFYMAASAVKLIFNKYFRDSRCHLTTWTKVLPFPSAPVPSNHLTVARLLKWLQDYFCSQFQSTQLWK